MPQGPEYKLLCASPTSEDPSGCQGLVALLNEANDDHYEFVAIVQCSSPCVIVRKK